MLGLIKLLYLYQTNKNIIYNYFTLFTELVQPCFILLKNILIFVCSLQNETKLIEITDFYQ